MPCLAHGCTREYSESIFVIPGLSRESPAKQSITFLRAARFLSPENQAAVEALIHDHEVVSCIPNYKSFSGLDLQEYQVYARCILLDTVTGYRSQYLQVSGVVSL